MLLGARDCRICQPLTLKSGTELETLVSADTNKLFKKATHKTLNSQESDNQKSHETNLYSVNSKVNPKTCMAFK